MDRQSRFFLAFVLCAVIVGISACSATTKRVGPSQAAMINCGVESGDAVLVRYANKGDPRSSSSSKKIRLSGVNENGISGLDENGEVVDVSYDDIFQIEYKTVGPIKSDSPALIGAGKAVNVTAKALFVAACILSGGPC